MNSTEYIWGYSNEKIMIHVGKGIEKQLKKWDDVYYEVDISESLPAELQDQSPYLLDKEIWLGLEQQGLMGMGIT